MNNSIDELIAFLRKNDGINDKAKLAKLVSDNFDLTKDRSVYYCNSFAIRFSSSATQNFGNTILSLSNLQKFDDGYQLKAGHKEIKKLPLPYRAKGSIVTLIKNN